MTATAAGALMGSFLAGRAQMGTSLGFHIIFASLGVGLPVAIMIAHFLALRRNDAGWLRLAARLTRALAVLVVVGVISGIVISIEPVLIWPQFMAKAGPVIGLPFSLETYAFFIEAIFLSLYLFARDRLRPWVHWATMSPPARARTPTRARGSGTPPSAVASPSSPRPCLSGSPWAPRTRRSANTPPAPAGSCSSPAWLSSPVRSLRRAYQGPDPVRA